MDIVNFLREPIFWIVTTIAGLLWSVLANLVTPYFQRYLDQFYENRNQNKIMTILEKRTRVEKYFISYDDRDSTKIDVIHGLLRGIGLMVLGVATFLIANIIPYPILYLFYIAGSFFLYLGVNVFDKQNALLYQVRLAEERESALRKWMDANNVAPSEQEKHHEFLLSWDAKRFGIPEEILKEKLNAF